MTRRTDTISATDITGCLRGVVFKKQEKVTPALHPDLLAQFDLFRTFGETGQAIQQQLTNFWRTKGVLISGGDFIPSDTYGFSGRFDTLCQIGGKLVLFEIKGVSISFFAEVQKSKKARDYNRMQIMIYHKSLASQYPGLEARLLYVPRQEFKQGTLKGVEVPVTYTDDEFAAVMERAESIRSALAGGTLPVAASIFAENAATGAKTIAMDAMMCRYHALCTGDPDWYVHARAETTPDDAVAESAEEEVPF